MQDFIKNIIEDVRVDLTDEFVQNLIDKGFFGKKWENTKIPNRKGSMMIRSGNLFRDIKKPKVSGNQITWSSSLPYASLQNEGGEVIVTEKMKRFFWAMFYKANGAVSKTQKGDARNNDRNKRLTAEAAAWKALALQKVGAKMKIKQRQFIGDHPQVRQRIEHVIDKNMKELEKTIFNQLKP
jgi:phage gpG-like protein